MKKAIAYVRVSTTEQAQHGCSLEAQEERVRAYCTMTGLDLVAVVRDEGVSASKALATRPGGQRVLDALKSEGVQHVVALKLDRLFRDAADCLNQTKSWDRAGVALHLVDMGGTTINTASPMGRMFMTLTAAFAELERNLIAERTRTALQFKKAQGVKLGGVRPTATMQDEATIARILELHAEAKTLREVAAVLEAEGFRTQRGGKWAPATIAKILARQEVA